MQPIVPITDEGVPTSIVPTGMSPQVPIRSQLSGPGGGVGGGGGGVGGLQIPTSMEQMTAQATSFLKKIAPTPPSQPPAAPQKESSALFVSGDELNENPDIIIGGKVFFSILFSLASSP